MVRISHLLLAAAGLLPCLRPFPVEGQSVPSPYRFLETRQEAGFFVGVTGQGTGRFGYGPAPGLSLGARYGLHLGGPFGLEAVFSYSPTTRDLVDPTREEGTRVVGDADANLLSLDARLRFSLTGDRSWRGLNPFLFAGIGLVWDSAPESEAEGLVLPEDRFKLGRRVLAPVGGGVRWMLSDRFLIRADVALAMFQLKSPPGYRNPDKGLEKVGEKEWVSGPTLSLGAAIHF